MIYFLLFITLLGYTFINRVSGLFFGGLFYCIIFFPLILPLIEEYERVVFIEKGTIKTCKNIFLFYFKISSFAILSCIAGIIFFSWLLN